MRFIAFISTSMLLAICFFHCSNVSNQPSIVFYQDPNSNLCIFSIDNSFVTIHDLEDDLFDIPASQDSLYNILRKSYNEIGITQKLSCADTILIANSRHEVYRKQFCWLFNIKIIGQKWIVSLYFPFNNIKGTYTFHITEAENRLFKGLVHQLVNNEITYYPAIDTSKTNTFGPMAATYIGIWCDEEQTEFFGSIEYPEMSAVTQLAIILNQKYIRPKKKINDVIGLLHVRDRFNHFKEIDSHTGSLIEDHDSIIQRIPAPGMK